MPGAAEEALRVDPLGLHHDRASFARGVEPLDRYLQSQACQDARKNMAAPFVLVLPDWAIVSYDTLSATRVKLADLPDQASHRLPRYPLGPATLLGRVAVDRRSQGKGYGGFLLADALYRVARNEIASSAVIVDARDESARRFYERESFLSFADQSMKLLRPVADIKKLFTQLIGGMSFGFSGQR